MVRATIEIGRPSHVVLSALSQSRYLHQTMIKPSADETSAAGRTGMGDFAVTYP